MIDYVAWIGDNNYIDIQMPLLHCTNLKVMSCMLIAEENPRYLFGGLLKRESSRMKK